MNFRCFKGSCLSLVILLVLSTIFNCSLANAQAGAITLKCEHLKSPMGVDEPHPRLSWQINDRQASIRHPH